MHLLESNEYKFMGAVTFYRHGARTPLHFVDTKVLPTPQWTLAEHAYEIPESNILLHPNTRRVAMSMNELLPGGAPPGSLTKAGQLQILQLGREYQRRYGDGEKETFHNKLPHPYHPSQMYIRSTDIRRNILSTRCFLAGMYSTNHFRDYQNPAYFEVFRADEEILYPNMALFPQLEKAFKDGHEQVAKVPEVIEMKRRLKVALNMPVLADSMCPQKRPTDMALYQVRDDLIARRVHGQVLPSSLEFLWSDLEKLSCLELLHEFFGAKKNWQSNAQVVFGPVFEMVQKNLHAMCENLRGPFFYFYTTHDSLLLPTLYSWGHLNWKWPPFAADLAIELFQDTRARTEISSSQYNPQDFWVRLVYCGQPLDVCTVQRFALAPLSSQYDVDLSDPSHCVPQHNLLSMKAFDILLSNRGAHIPYPL